MKRYKIGVIIVTYFPNLKELTLNINNLLSDGVSIFIYKNCNTELPFEKQSNIIIKGNGENIGLSKAQNIGLQYFLKTKVDFVSTFDQDSTITKNYLQDAMENLVQLNSVNSKIRVIVPYLVDKDSTKLISKEKVIKKVDGFTEILREGTCSGMFMFSSIIEDYGDFRENFFIDYIDFEWSWRIRLYGEKIARSKRLTIYHSLGEGDINILGKTISVCNSDRIYYQIRNLKYLKSYKYTPKKWIVKQKIRLILRIIIYTIYSKNLDFIKQALRGLRAYRSLSFTPN